MKKQIVLVKDEMGETIEVDISPEALSALLVRAWSVIEKERPKSERKLLDSLSHTARALRMS